MSDTIFMQTTGVSAATSAAEITGLLVRAGSKQITTEYSDGHISGICFSLEIAGMSYVFKLPARTDPVYKTLMRSKPYNSYRRCNRQEYETEMRKSAERIGWRQLFRWVQAQIAIIDIGMVAAHEVFLPYMLVGGNRTVLQMFEEQQFKMLTAGNPEANQ